MAIIYSYPQATPKASDLLIGTVTYDSTSGTPVDGNPTRTFNIGDIANLLGGYTLSSQAAGLNANIVLTSNLGAISAVNLLRGTGISISDNGTNGITLGNTGVLSIVASNSTFVSSTPVLSSTGNVTISSSLSAIGTPSSSNYLRGDNRWSTPVTTITTQDSQFINLTPNSSTNGAVTITAQLSAGGSPSSSNFLRGDNVWAVPAGGGTVTSVLAGTGIAVDNSNPSDPVVSNTGVLSNIAGTGISISNATGNSTITNTAPDQTVVITGSGDTTVTGTYPTFNISSDSGVTQIVAGNDISISPIGGTGIVTINSTSQGGVTSLIAGDNITLDPITGLGDVTVNAPGLIPYTETSTANIQFVSEDVALGGGASSDTVVPSQLAVKTYVDNAVVGGLIYQGAYDASTNTPVLDSRGTQIAVTKGWTYTVTVDGTFYGETVKVGDVLIAETDLAAGTGALTDWTTVQSNIDLATAGTDATAVRGLAGFDTDNFTVVNGFVNLKVGDIIPSNIVESVVAGANVTVDNTDPKNPIVSASGNPIPVSEEGVQVTPSVASFNFTGTGVTATAVGNDVTVNVAQAQSVSNLVYDVRNQTGAEIPAGSAVYIVGGSGASDHVNVVLALADNDEHSSKTFGITSAAIPDNSIGPVTLEGLIEGIDTDLWNNGDTLWLSPTVPGGIQNTIPLTPAHAVFLGYAVRIQQNNGSIFVKIQNGPELSELHDVLITNVQNNQTITWDTTNSYWKNTNIANSVTGANSTFISTSTDVTTGAVTVTSSLSATGTPDATTFLRGDNQWVTVAGTTYDYSSAQSGSDVDLNLIPSTGVTDTVKLVAGSGISLTDDGSNNVTIAASSSSSIAKDDFVGDGTTQAFALSVTPFSTLFTSVYIAGVYQEKETYSITDSTLTFTTAPPNTASIEVMSVVVANVTPGANTITRNDFTGTGTTTDYTLTVAPSSINFVDVYVSGTYQNKDTFTIVGTTLSFSEAPANSDEIEVIIISNVSLVQNEQVNYGVNTISTSTTASKNNLYVLTADLTVTLPASPANGDSIKISNLSGVATCILARNGSLIMGVAADLTLDTPSASFELVYSGATKGWVIIGL